MNNPLSQEHLCDIYVTWFIFLVVMVLVGITFDSWLSGLASAAERDKKQKVSECKDKGKEMRCPMKLRVSDVTCGTCG